MAVALATLPLKRLLAGTGDAAFGATVGTALAEGLGAAALAGADLLLTVFETGLTGSATGFVATVATGLPTGAALAGDDLAMTGLLADGLTGAFFAGAACLAGAFVTAVFLAGALFTGTFFTAAFLAGDFNAELSFFGCGWVAIFFAETLTTAFLATTGLATTFLAAAFFIGLATGVFFAVFLVALFTVVPFLAAVLDWLLVT